MSEKFLEQCELVIQDIDGSFDVKNITANKSETIFYVHGAHEFSGSFYEIAQIGIYKNSYQVTKHTEEDSTKCGYYFIYDSCFIPARRI